MGAWVTVVIVILFTLNNACSIAVNFWLSAWADDGNAAAAAAGNATTQEAAAAAGNSTESESVAALDTAQRDMRLGVYGALGLGQCKSRFYTYRSSTIFYSVIGIPKVLY